MQVSESGSWYEIRMFDVNIALARNPPAPFDEQRYGAGSFEGQVLLCWQEKCGYGE